MSSKPMQRARVDGAELEYEVRAPAEPVVLIHGAFIAEAYAPLCAEPALDSRYRLVRYHRRGYAGSSPVRRRSASPSRPPTAGRCWRTWASSAPTSSATPPAGPSPCSWRSTRRRSCTPWCCWSRGCSTSRAEPCSRTRSSRLLERYGAGDKEGATDGFLRGAIGPDYRAWLDRLIPGAYAQVVADADTCLRRRAAGARGVAVHAGGRPADHPARPRRARRRERHDLAGLERGSGAAV